MCIFFQGMPIIFYNRRHCCCCCKLLWSHVILFTTIFTHKSSRQISQTSFTPLLCTYKDNTHNNHTRFSSSQRWRVRDSLSSTTLLLLLYAIALRFSSAFILYRYIDDVEHVCVYMCFVHFVCLYVGRRGALSSSLFRTRWGLLSGWAYQMADSLAHEKCFWCGFFI